MSSEEHLEALTSQVTALASTIEDLITQVDALTTAMETLTDQLTQAATAGRPPYVLAGTHPIVTAALEHLPVGTRLTDDEGDEWVKETAGWVTDGGPPLDSREPACYRPLTVTHVPTGSNNKEDRP